MQIFKPVIFPRLVLLVEPVCRLLHALMAAKISTGSCFRNCRTAGDMAMIDKQTFHPLNYIKKEEYSGSMDGMRYLLKKVKSGEEDYAAISFMLTIFTHYITLFFQNARYFYIFHNMTKYLCKSCRKKASARLSENAAGVSMWTCLIKRS